MKQLFLFMVFVISLSSIKAQSLSKEQVIEDLTQLREGIERFNPTVEQYNPRFQNRADSLISSVSKSSLSNYEAFDLISQLCAFSNEGHFSLGTWEDQVHQGIINNEVSYIPLVVKIANSKLYVWLDLSDEQVLKRGAEIISINGLSSSEILKKLYQSTPSDGRILTYSDRTIENNFSWMYFLYVDKIPGFEIETMLGSGIAEKNTIQALTREKHFENYEKFYPERIEKQKETEVDAFHSLSFSGTSATLTLPSFDRRRVEKYDVDSKKLYKGIFTELKEKAIQNLIIDLRGNTGGLNEFADDIVPFIQKRPSDSPLLKRTISWEERIRNYRFPKASNVAFEGQIYALVNGRTYSAGSTLARYLKEYGDAVFIGEETGTRYEGFSAGSQEYVMLENTQIRIGIPRYHITFDPSEKQTTSNRGLLPDFLIQPTIEELLEETDLHMKKAKKLISEKNSSN